MFFQMKLSCITINPDPPESLAGKPVELELAYATQSMAFWRVHQRDLEFMGTVAMLWFDSDDIRN